MTVELAAVRLLAPWFGTSAGVWTNVIGVILLALALGYLCGARFATRERPLRSLGLVLIAAAAFTVWLPFLAQPVCEWFLPEGLSLHQAAGLWLWGSLAASLLLFLPPALVIGCVGPLAVEVVQRGTGGHAGTAGGQVLCVSTLGSLAGTFATTHLLLPFLGMADTLRLAAAVLFLVGVIVLIASQAPRGIGRAALLVLFAVPGVWLGAEVGRPALPEGLEVLASAESPYQSLRVVEDKRWGTPFRMLQVNEGLDSFQSVWQPEPGLLGQGFYYDYFALPAWWDARPNEPWRTLVLGLGAGTAFRVLRGATPPGRELDLWGIELDEEVARLGREYLDLEHDGDDVHVFAGEDARTALRRMPRDFDYICLDTYANQVEIPSHLCTVEFFGEIAEHLRPGGWVAVNVGGFGPEDPVVWAVGRTMAQVFEGLEGGDVGAHVVAVRVAASRNWMLFGRKQAPIPEPGSAEWDFEGPVGEALLPALSLPDAVRPFSVGTPRAVLSLHERRLYQNNWILTDDRSPMTLLQRMSLEHGREAFLRP